MSNNLVSVVASLLAGGSQWPLFLYGPTGTGKTCAALALCDHVETAAYFTHEDICETVMGSDEEEKFNTWGMIAGKSLVVLDEIGARGVARELGYSTMRKVLDHREQYHHRIAVYISNVEPEQIQNLFDDRVASRMLCGTWCCLDGKDRRGAT